MDSYDQTLIDKQTTSLTKILNARDWPGLRVYWKEKRFVIKRGSYETWYIILDERTFLDPFKTPKHAWDLFLLLTLLDPKSEQAHWEFYALAHGEEPEMKAHSAEAKTVHPNAFALAKSAMPLRRMMELHDVPYEDTGHGTFTFTLWPQGRKERYVTYPNNVEFFNEGVQAQRLDSYSLWRLLNGVLTDSADDRSEFISYVSQRVDDETAAKLAA